MGDTSIKVIPRIMRQKGMYKGAQLMDIWFSLPGGFRKPFYAAPVTNVITMNWVLNTFPRVKRVFDKMVAEKIWENPAARVEIYKWLRTDSYLLNKYAPGNVPGKIPFGNIADPPEIQHSPQVNFRAFDEFESFRGSPGVTYDLDDLFAALGNFTFYVVVAGTVAVSIGKPGHEVTINEVGIYIKDSYDFEGDQYLGRWSDGNGYDRNIGNEDFQNYRQSSGTGGDFLIYSDIMRVPISPVTFNTWGYEV